MPAPSSLGGALLILLLLAVLLWFALGTQRNVRRGNDLVRWLQDGLPRLGPRTTVRWIGSSAVVLSIVDPRPPLLEAEVVVVLEPRDVGLLWAWTRARGRRDFLILRARLERSPAFELEAGDASGWTGRERLDRLDPGGWERTAWDAVEVAYTPGADLDGALRAWNALGGAGGRVWRMSVRRNRPHLEVHAGAGPSPGSADALVGAFVDLAMLADRR